MVVVHAATVRIPRALAPRVGAAAHRVAGPVPVAHRHALIAVAGHRVVHAVGLSTNHLDMESITALNNGLIKFPGVLLFTSRDHQIVQTTANRIMEIVPGGKLIDKITTYDEYLESDEMARKRQTYSVQTDDED